MLVLFAHVALAGTTTHAPLPEFPLAGFVHDGDRFGHDRETEAQRQEHLQDTRQRAD